MAGRPKYTVQQVADALTASHGFLSGAAKKLDCSRETIKGYLKRHASLQAHVADIRENNLDFAEGQLLRLIKEGDITAIIFFLKTQGRERGYTERLQVEGPSENLAMFTAQLAAARAAHNASRLN